MPSRLEEVRWGSAILHIPAFFTACILLRMLGRQLGPTLSMSNKHVQASPQALDELLEKLEASSPSPTHTHQLGSSPGAPRHSQQGQAWPRHVSDPCVPHCHPAASLTSGLCSSQAFALALGTSVGARVVMLTAVVIIAHELGALSLGQALGQALYMHYLTESSHSPSPHVTDEETDLNPDLTSYVPFIIIIHIFQNVVQALLGVQEEMVLVYRQMLYLLIVMYCFNVCWCRELKSYVFPQIHVLKP